MFLFLQILLGFWAFMIIDTTLLLGDFTLHGIITVIMIVVSIMLCQKGKAKRHKLKIIKILGKVPDEWKDEFDLHDNDIDKQ